MFDNLYAFRGKNLNCVTPSQRLFIHVNNKILQGMLHAQAITDRLHSLRLNSDQAILAGKSFEEVKKIYIEMKQTYSYSEEPPVSGCAQKPQTLDELV